MALGPNMALSGNPACDSPKASSGIAGYSQEAVLSALMSPELPLFIVFKLSLTLPLVSPLSTHPCTL